MKRYESAVKYIPYSQNMVYSMLSNLNNIALLKDMLPQEKIKDLSYSTDSVSFNVSPIGSVALSIVEREPSKCIKLKATKSPLDMTLWIQIVSTNAEECKMKLTLDADVNLFIAKMVEKPLREGIEQIANALAAIPYNITQ